MKKNIISLFVLLLATSISEKVYSQEAVKPRPSPMAVATMKYEDTYIKVTYCRPHKKGREIFGGLEQFGKVWRTGANEATEITFTKGIKFGGKALAAGTYSLFTIPNEKSWIVILNSELGQWGAYNYDESKDVLRVETSVGKTDTSYEPFTIEFKQNDQGADLVMMWDMTMIRIPIAF
ncbi:DUF2911 domain-containing protein [Bacteroidota bacterium]